MTLIITISLQSSNAPTNNGSLGLTNYTCHAKCVALVVSASVQATQAPAVGTGQAAFAVAHPANLLGSHIDCRNLRSILFYPAKEGSD